MSAPSNNGTSTLPIDLTQYHKLTREQAGHLRHFHNLVTQPDGQWHHMGPQDPMQEYLDAYRYQLATMAYAAGIAHYHHLPALRGVFQPLLRSTIAKMLRREVWAYWYSTSVSGKRVDPDLQELRRPWADPVVRENIMYSGHLLLMVSLYAMLFDDAEFEAEGALEFRWDPLFFGMGSETFKYSAAALQDAILKQMERAGYLGVCCEPNMVFVVCNQFPIVAVCYNDIRHGTSKTPDLLTKYRAAWARKGGFLATNGQMHFALLEKQGVLLPSPGPGITAWACAFMNIWNAEYVRSIYADAALGHITQTEGVGVRLHPAKLGNVLRRLVTAEHAPATAQATLEQAKAIVRAESVAAPAPAHAFNEPTFGYVVQWLSELGKHTELDGLLAYADTKLRPTWEEGGLFYTRNDCAVDDELEFTAVDPYTGNAAIGYARLNVENGQKMMWERPWTAKVLAGRPWVEGVKLGSGVDFLRGVWDEAVGCLVVTARTWDGQTRKVEVVFRNLGVGGWTLYEDGRVVLREVVKGEGGMLRYEVEFGEREKDLVLVREGGVRGGEVLTSNL